MNKKIHYTEAWRDSFRTSSILLFSPSISQTDFSKTLQQTKPYYTASTEFSQSAECVIMTHNNLIIDLNTDTDIWYIYGWDQDADDEVFRRCQRFTFMRFFDGNSLPSCKTQTIIRSTTNKRFAEVHGQRNTIGRGVPDRFSCTEYRTSSLNNCKPNRTVSCRIQLYTNPKCKRRKRLFHRTNC